MKTQKDIIPYLEHWWQYHILTLPSGWHKNLPINGADSETLRSLAESYAMHPYRFLVCSGVTAAELETMSGELITYLIFAADNVGVATDIVRAALSLYLPDERNIWQRAVMARETADGFRRLRFEPSVHATA